MSDTTEIPDYITRSPDTVRTQIMQSWEVGVRQLAEMRAHRAKLNEAIKAKVDELREQRKLVRIVAPELLQSESNGE